MGITLWDALLAGGAGAFEGLNRGRARTREEARQQRAEAFQQDQAAAEQRHIRFQERNAQEQLDLSKRNQAMQEEKFANDKAGWLSPEERQAAKTLEKQMAEYELQKAKLENERLAADIQRLKERVASGGGGGGGGGADVGTTGGIPQSLIDNLIQPDASAAGSFLEMANKLRLQAYDPDKTDEADRAGLLKLAQSYSDSADVRRGRMLTTTRDILTGEQKSSPTPQHGVSGDTESKMSAYADFLIEKGIAPGTQRFKDEMQRYYNSLFSGAQ